jgi:hypothetical protein
VARDGRHGIADLVVVPDGVLGFVGRIGFAAGAFADAQQGRVEDPFLGLCVDLQKRRQPRPDRTQGAYVGAVDLIENGELPALLVVIVEDQLRDVHCFPLVVWDATVGQKRRPMIREPS